MKIKSIDVTKLLAAVAIMKEMEIRKDAKLTLSCTTSAPQIDNHTNCRVEMAREKREPGTVKRVEHAEWRVRDTSVGESPLVVFPFCFKHEVLFV